METGNMMMNTQRTTVPLMFSFVVLILQWILKPIAFVATYLICYPSAYIGTYIMY